VGRECCGEKGSGVFSPGILVKELGWENSRPDCTVPALPGYDPERDCCRTLWIRTRYSRAPRS